MKIDFPVHLLDEALPALFRFENRTELQFSLIDRKAPFVALYQTIAKLGHEIGRFSADECDISIRWTAKTVTPELSSKAIIVEMGWLPRWNYQVSPTGSNFMGHYAREYRYRALSNEERTCVRDRLERLHAIYKSRIDVDRVRRLKERVGGRFVLFPLQLANDFNLKYSDTEFASLYSATENRNVELFAACMGKVAGVSRKHRILFKQHPFDPTPSLRKLLSNSALVLDNTENYSAHEIFATGLCDGVVSVNSNTVHEASVWNVPSLCLGKLIWDKEAGRAPYASDLGELSRCLASQPHYDDGLLPYLRNLVRHQWTLSDFQNPLMVEALIASRGRGVPWDLREAVGV